MPGIVGLSVSKRKRKKFSSDLFLGILYEQHWNEEQAGVAIWDEKRKRLITDSKPGHFRIAFEKRMLEKGKNEFDGVAGIGYCGISKEPLESL